MSVNWEDFRSLKLRAVDGVAFVVIDHPPMNLLDLQLIRELDRAAQVLEASPEVRVVVLSSGDQDFFIAHADVNLIRELSREVDVAKERHRLVQRLVERFRAMSKVTIGQIEGRARGGGSEILLALDMRFAALGRALLAQPEIAFGLVPGGGATQFLPRLVGRSRALEILLTGSDLDAALAEQYGYVNRALPPDELGPFVENLAHRVARFPAAAITRIKRAIGYAELAADEGLRGEAELFRESIGDPAVEYRLAAFVALGGQTRRVALGATESGGNSAD